MESRVPNTKAAVYQHWRKIRGYEDISTTLITPEPGFTRIRRGIVSDQIDGPSQADASCMDANGRHEVVDVVTKV